MPPSIAVQSAQGGGTRVGGRGGATSTASSGSRRGPLPGSVLGRTIYTRLQACPIRSLIGGKGSFSENTWTRSWGRDGRRCLAAVSARLGGGGRERGGAGLSREAGLSRAADNN